MPLLNNESQVTIPIKSGLDHAEGIAWGLDGYVYAGGEAGQIYRINLQQEIATEFANTGGFVLGLALDASHNIYACDIVSKSVLKISPGGIVSTYSKGTKNRPFKTPNYPTFDSHGNLYVCDSGDWKSDNGAIYKIRPGGHTELWDKSLKEFPNGLCLSHNSDFLYVAMSLNPPRVDRIKIESDGTAGTSETAITLPGSVPDGVALDTSGNLYVSCYRPDRIYRLTSSGQLDILAEDPEGTLMACPTNVAFCGKNLDILLSSNFGRWHITQYHVEENGLKLQYPSLN